MDRDSKLTEKVIKYCKKIGVDISGFCDPILYDEYVKGKRPELYLKDSKTVIVIGISINDIILDTWYHYKKGGKSYHFADSVLENFCHKVKNFILDQGYDSKIIPYNPGLFLKDAAALAGIGPLGKNNLLVTNQFGPQVRLRALVTTAPLDVGTPIFESKYCKECDICIRSCPAGALKDGRYNKRLCLDYNQSHLRKLSDTSAIWCNICIESCPVGK